MSNHVPMPAAFARPSFDDAAAAAAAPVSPAVDTRAAAQAPAAAVSRKRRFAELEAAATAAPTSSQMEDIMQLVDSAAEVVELNARGVRSLAMRLMRAAKLNTEARVRYEGQPTKFMDSEIALDDAIVALSSLAARPDLYAAFVDATATPALLQLLAHENSDIGGAVVSLLVELCDAAALTDDGAASFLDALLANDALRLIVQAGQRVDESGGGSDAATLLHSVLAIAEALVEARVDVVAATLLADTPLLALLFTRLRTGDMDANQLYCAELLAVTVQAGGEVGNAAVVAASGVKKCLRLLGRYRRRTPESSEEIEYVENLFNALCAMLVG
jgi:beta-catenin-like protein 1